MNKIKLLDPKTINLINAGEVIESPADILKELIENSIDANSKNIKIKIENSGIDLLEISDDGDGINKDDLKNSIKRHATSKLKDINELYSLESYGFRGEALASISSISEFLIKSSINKSGEGYILENQEVKKISFDKGTKITIKNLFYNQPVRKKFLKSKSFEFTKLYNTFLSFVLKNPEINFYFDSEKKNVIFKQTNQENRYYQVFGKDIKDKTYFIDIKNDFFKLKGIVSKPNNGFYYPTNFLFINNRFVYSNSILKAITSSYKDYLMVQQKPFFVLFFEFDKRTVDVNVHPKKRIVKLQNEILLTNQIRKELINFFDKNLEKKTIDVSSSLNDYVKSNNFSYEKNPNFSSSFSNKEYLSNNFKKENNYFKEDLSSKQTFFENNDLNQDIYLLNKKITKVIGQIHDTFIVCQTDDGFIIVDQHAAAERVNLEKNRDQIKDELIKQNLVIEKRLDNLTESNIYILEKNKELINKFGFDFYKKDDFYFLKTIPVFLNNNFDENILINFLKDLEENSEDISKLKDNLVKLKSCKQSLKANKELTIPQQIDLLRNLNNCKDSGICAHGRPTAIFLKISDLEKMFKRIV